MIGQRLVAAGHITAAQLELALLEQRRTNATLRQILVALRLVTPEVIAELLAKDALTDMVELRELLVPPEVLRLVPYPMARQYCAIPIARAQNTLTVALADPFDVVAIDTLHQATQLSIHVVTASDRDILNAIDRHYRNTSNIRQLIERIIDDEQRDPRPIRQTPAVKIEAGDEDAPVIQLVAEIIARAAAHGASDIHFEPDEKNLRIRTRIDGVMFVDVLLPKSMQSLVTTRLKILGDMDVAETRLTQDGRATVYVDRRQINLRISSLPNRYGENLVVRLLEAEREVPSLLKLGFSTQVRQGLLNAMGRPHGVVIMTGPTGSGKSTTQYAALTEIDTSNLSVFTLEDPIEYTLPGVSQTQVREDIGLTFSNCLRTLLRQDPDVILVGETRDTETAQLMVRAALTGHLVITTLHTNDAAGAIPRLLDMGVEPYLLPASLIAVLGQRLIRAACPECRMEVPNPETAIASLGVTPPTDLPLRLWRVNGCENCRQSGYRGRLGIYELMLVDERFHDPIIRRSGAPEYLRLAREHGMTTMLEDGVRKSVEGRTTLEEVLRIVGPAF
ncbi:MAG TPA: GspE/PulE family protein [Verrucomicrobiota bacterium]|nr:GspE/PulE family protein [Verrucomicrobiota bacterium]